MADKHNIDDLIGSNSPNIIIENTNNDKKFLMIIIILLIILFLIAIGVIALISNKNFSQNKTYLTKSQDQNRANNNALSKAASGIKNKTYADNNSNIDELEKIVSTKESRANQTISQPNQAIKSTLNSVTDKKLSKEELAILAKLVAKELAKEQKKSSSKNKQTSSSDEELVKSLQNAQTDTLKDEVIDTNNLKKDTKVKNSNQKAVDTYNKVIVQEGVNEDDEMAKLSAEIDSILGTKEVEQKEKNLKYAKELKEDIKTREREMRFIVVKKGDTLSSIAYRAYGRASAYKKIYEANPDLIKNPNKIYVGMKLRVPVDEEYLKRQGN